MSTTVVPGQGSHRKERRVGRAWGYRIDPYSVAGDLKSQAADQAKNGALRGSVVCGLVRTTNGQFG